jgi:energy-coupling factor transporter ATP-binding protein EcfA2
MILEISGVDTYYGLGHILHGLSLAVAEGEVVALLGRNGAGKTTTLRSISGLTPPRRGTIAYKGANIAGVPAHRISRLGIALVPETRGIFTSPRARTLRSPDVPARGGRWRRCWSGFPSSARSWIARGASSLAGSSRCWPSPARS